MTPAAVIATLTGYIALLFVVAWISGRRTDNAGFFTANRRTPWYLAAFAMVGAAMSGVTFISVPGSVAADSFSYMQMVAGFTVGQLIVAYLLVPTFYRLKLVSLYEYLDDRFGARTHAAGAWCFFVAKMLGAALQVYVVCTVMQLLVFDRYGLPFWLNAAVTMALVWLYTRQGGVRSLIRTDILKTCCLIASLVLSILFITRALGLSFGEMAREVAASPHSRILFLDDPASDRYFWKMFVAGIVTLVAMTGLGQDMMQRNMSCPTPRDAQKNILLYAYRCLRTAFGTVCVRIKHFYGNVYSRLNARTTCAVGKPVDLESGHGADRGRAPRADERQRICRICGDRIGQGENDAGILSLLDAGVKHALRLQTDFFAQTVHGISVDRPGTFIRLKIGKKGHFQPPNVKSSEETVLSPIIQYMTLAPRLSTLRRKAGQKSASSLLPQSGETSDPCLSNAHSFASLRPPVTRIRWVG